MKRTAFYVFLMAILLVVSSVQDSQAFWGKKKKEAAEVKESQEIVQTQAEVKTEIKTEAVEQKPSVKKAAAKPSESKILREKSRKKLDNSSWQIEVFPIAGGGKKIKDVLNFKDNQVVSEKYEAGGFNASNYTLTVKPDGVTIWETMQSAEDGKIIFWRGEIDEKMKEMRGVLSTQPAPEKTEDFSFISLGREAIKN